jgi:hypothetical protein
MFENTVDGRKEIDELRAFCKDIGFNYYVDYRSDRVVKGFYFKDSHGFGFIGYILEQSKERIKNYIATGNW